MTSKRDSQTTPIFKISKSYLKGALKWPRYLKKKTRWSCVDFPSVEIISKKYIRMTSIIRPSKLQQQSTSKWHGNSLMLFNSLIFVDIRWYTCRRWFDLLSLLVRTKLVLVSAQNHLCFNIKFWRCFSVDKM